MTKNVVIGILITVIGIHVFECHTVKSHLQHYVDCIGAIRNQPHEEQETDTLEYPADIDYYYEAGYYIDSAEYDVEKYLLEYLLEEDPDEDDYYQYDGEEDDEEFYCNC